MRTLLIDENGIMYWASLLDIRDLRAGIRRPSTVLPSLERAEASSVSTEEWKRREYVDFLCNTYANGRKHTTRKVKKGGRIVSAYLYLQSLMGFQTVVAACIDGRMYLIPMADALGYALDLMESEEVRSSAVGGIDNLGVTNYLIIE